MERKLIYINIKTILAHRCEFYRTLLISHHSNLLHQKRGEVIAIQFQSMVASTIVRGKRTEKYTSK